MPVMDGMSATRAIRQYEAEYGIPRSYIIALTGLASASAKLEAWNAGLDQYMVRPVSFKALGTCLQAEKEKREGRREGSERGDGDAGKSGDADIGEQEGRRGESGSGGSGRTAEAAVEDKR